MLIVGGRYFSSMSSNAIFRVFDVSFTWELGAPSGFHILYIWMWKLLQEIREKNSISLLKWRPSYNSSCVMSSSVSVFLVTLGKSPDFV